MAPSSWVPKTQFPTASYPTSSPHLDLSPFLPLFQSCHVALPGWLLPAPLLQPGSFPSQTNQHNEELGLGVQRAESGAQPLSVLREKKQTSQESGDSKRDVLEGLCWGKGFLLHPKGMLTSLLSSTGRLSWSPVLVVGKPESLWVLGSDADMERKMVWLPLISTDQGVRTK